MLKVSIYHPGRDEPIGSEFEGESYQDVKAHLRTLLGDWPEHVTVLYEGRRADMFVGERSAGQLPVNKAATEIYWNASKARGEVPTGAWPHIYGPAVLFETVIWT